MILRQDMKVDREKSIKIRIFKNGLFISTHTSFDQKSNTRGTKVVEARWFRVYERREVRIEVGKGHRNS